MSVFLHSVQSRVCLNKNKFILLPSTEGNSLGSAQCKSLAEKPGPKVEKPGSRRSEVSEFLEPTSHSELYFHGPGLVRPHDLEFYRCWPKFVQIDSSQLCLDLQALRNLESIQHPLHYVQLQNSTTLSKLDCVHKFPPSLLWKLKVIFFNSTMKFPPFFYGLHRR